MKKFWTAAAFAVATLLAGAGCNDYGNTFQAPTGAAISSLSPADIPAGSPQFTLRVNGAGFVAKTVVQWNSKTIATQVETDSSGNVTGLTATVPASLVATPGTAFVNTLSPHSGAGTNGLSNSLAFIINPPPNPVPTLSSISPAQAPAGSSPVALTISGSNFLPTASDSTAQPCSAGATSCVNWNMGATQTTFNTANSPGMSITASTIQLTIPSSLLATAGCPIVTVYNPPSPQVTPTGGVPTPSAGGGGTSPKGQTFTVGSAGSCPSTSAKPASQSETVALEETPAVSANGRFVAYTAIREEHAQVFVRDTCEGAPSGCLPSTTLVSATAENLLGNADSRSPSMSADGRFVAFSSSASNLLADTPAGRQIYLRDTCFGAEAGSCKPSTQLISNDPNGALGGSEAILPSISSSGRFVAFVAVTTSHTRQHSSQSRSSTNPNSGYRQVFVRDTCFGASDCTPKTTRISLQPGDGSDIDAKPAGPALSGSATHVALPDASTSTLFTRGIPVDDRVFLAATQPKP
jgi:WD40-like Beta Propeller Repeat